MKNLITIVFLLVLSPMLWAQGNDVSFDYLNVDHDTEKAVNLRLLEVKVDGKYCDARGHWWSCPLDTPKDIVLVEAAVEYYGTVSNIKGYVSKSKRMIGTVALDASESSDNIGDQHTFTFYQNGSHHDTINIGLTRQPTY